MSFLSVRMVTGLFAGAVVGFKAVQKFYQLTDVGQTLSSIGEGRAILHPPTYGRRVRAFRRRRENSSS